MPFLTLDSVSAATPDQRPLFSDLSLSLNRERIGIVGRNGAGKSTLLAIAAGLAEPASGTVTATGRVGLLRQIQPTEETLAVALGIDDALARLARIEQGNGLEADLLEADWLLPERISSALQDVGLEGFDLHRTASSLSGGERTRLGLARLLIDAPDVLLLDEPTNNLDVGGRALIAGFLARWKGGALVASHDRTLLDGMDRILHLSSMEVKLYAGGWSAYFAAREQERRHAETALTRADSALKQTRQSVQRQSEKKARRDKAGRIEGASGSNSKLLMDARKDRASRTDGRDSRLASRLLTEAEDALHTARARVEILTPLHIDLPRTGLPAGRLLLAFDDVVLERDGRRLFGPLSFTVQGPERLAVSGPNGSGKTSLLNLITGTLAPTSGEIRRADRPAAMLDQHVNLLDPALDLVENLLRHHPALDTNTAHAQLARFAFRNRDALRPAHSLSGGERLRAGPAIALARPHPPQLLILDEPTNHLDLDAIETLEAAMRDFDGALVVVSHDPHFLTAIGITRTLELGQRPLPTALSK